MRCPHCDTSESRVVDTTTHAAGWEIRRRRQCEACGRRFNTVEHVQSALPMIVKDDMSGLAPRRERFDADKLRQGIQIACAKRPIPPVALDRLVESIEARLIESHQSEVSSRRIGEMVIAGLRDLDEIAYLRYAMVFLKMDDLASVRREIDRLVDSQTEKERDGQK